MDFIQQNFPWLAGIGTAITLGWNYFKTGIFYLRNIFIRTIKISSYSSELRGYEMFLKIRENFKKTYYLNDHIKLDWDNFKGKKIRYSLSSPRSFLGITRKNIPIIITYLDDTSIDITFIRGTFKYKQVINDFIKYTEERENTINKNVRFSIKDKYGRLNEKITINTEETEGKNLKTSEAPSSSSGVSLVNNYGFFVTGKDDYQKEIENLNNNSEISFDLYDESTCNTIKTLKHWIENKEWFVERDIPWNRSGRVEGPPGTGKSTFITNLGRYLNLPIFKFHLTTMDSKDFQEAWKSVSEESPAIILLEDFDRLFNEDRSFKLDKLSLDTILNAISGVSNYNGILTIITANFPERLDPALGTMINGKSTRPGRLDFLIEINELSEKARYIIANKILDKFPESIDNIVSLGEGETASQFSQRCIELAQEKFWESYGLQN